MTKIIQATIAFGVVALLCLVAIGLSGAAYGSHPSHVAAEHRHHVARVRAAHRHHVARVRLERGEYLAAIRAAQASAHLGGPWNCIGLYESGNSYTVYSGRFGFISSTAMYYFGTPDAGSVSPARQDAAALAIWHANGDRWSGAWSTASVCGLP